MILPLDWDYDENDLFYLEYNPTQNAFYMAGYVFHNIFSIMTPNELYTFKNGKEDIIVRTNYGDLYYIVYDNYDEEDEYN
jgi:hypothetical protein